MVRNSSISGAKGSMTKGSVRKKGKKWYYRFYVENASGNLVQKECTGTRKQGRNGKAVKAGNGGL